MTDLNIVSSATQVTNQGGTETTLTAGIAPHMTGISTGTSSDSFINTSLRHKQQYPKTYTKGN